MIKSLLVTITMALFLTSCSSQPKLSKSAYEEFKKLEASIETGITFHDYSRRLGEVKYAVNAFLESEEASKHQDLAGDIRSALLEYELAATVWAFVFTPEKGIILMSDTGISIRQHIDKTYEWPSLVLESSRQLGMEILDPKKLLPFIWVKGSERLAKVRERLKDI